AKDETAARKLVDARRHSRQQCGMAERHGADECAEADSLRVLSHVDEGYECLEGVPVLWTHQGEEVIRAPERFEAQVFRRAHDSPPQVPAETFLTLDHQSQLHNHPSLVLQRLVQAGSPATSPTSVQDSC